MRSRHSKGFTLIELMIVVVVLGVIAAIALPSFTEQVRKSRRSDAKQALYDVAAKLEQYYMDNKGYPTAANMTLLGYDAAAFTSLEGFYTIGFNGVPTATTYSIQAVPTGSQASDAGCAAGKACCGTYRLDHLGQKTVNGATLAADKCW